MDLLSTARAAYRAGLLLTTDGHDLDIAGPHPPSDELRAALRANKVGLVALLFASGERYPTPPGCGRRRTCAASGWCPAALAGEPCPTGEETL